MRKRAMVLLPACIILITLASAIPSQAGAVSPQAGAVSPQAGAVSPQAAVVSPDALTGGQRAVLMHIAHDTWNFYSADVDANTSLPRDNIGFQGAQAQGNYTSPTNIGVYMWSIVAAHDLGLIDTRRAVQLLSRIITTTEGLRKWNGFLLSWYDTSTGHCLTGPGGTDCENSPIAGMFISTVDNGWYGAGLVVARQALDAMGSREARGLANRATVLLNGMNYGFFYDSSDQCTNITGGQMYGGYNAAQGPANFHYGLLNTETRIAAYMGIGTGTMPGDVWWRTWRTLPSLNQPPPPTNCATSDFNWQGQYPPQGYWTTYADPVSSKVFTMFEGHYTYSGIQFVPSWGGSMFEALMPNLVAPETEWGKQGFGENDRNYALMQALWATQGLGYPVWGLSPSSTPDDTGNYDAFGARGPAYPNAIASNENCCAYDQFAVTPHASFLALQVIPEQAYANIQNMRQLYPGLYGPYGFYDAVAPRDATYTSNGQTYTVHAGQVGHRYLVLDESMIMAALDNVLEHGAMQNHFGSDPVGAAARPYLSMEHFSIQPATTSNCTISFSDVHPNDYFYEPVRSLFCTNIISGYADGTFRPFTNTTRGQLAKIVTLAQGWAIDTSGGPHFNDVSANDPFYPFIETAFHHGVISGYGDGSFRPGNNVTRAQLSKIIVLARGWATNTTGGPHFNDVSLGNVFYPFVETAFNHGIISGYGDGSFRPGNNATRGQIAKIVYGALNNP